MATIKIEKEVPEISYELMEGIVKHLQGQVLTVVEASMADVTGAQITAVKSLIKSNFNDSLTRIYEIFMYHGGVDEGEIPKYEK